MTTPDRKPKSRPQETEYGRGYRSDLDEGRIEYGPKPHHKNEDINEQTPDDFNRYGGYYDTDDPRPYGGRYSYADGGSETEGYGREVRRSQDAPPSDDKKTLKDAENRKNT